MKNKLLLIALLGAANTGQQAEAQPVKEQNPYSGNLQFGFRTTINPLFKNGASWLSYGAQLRVKVSRRFNTEWFADYYPTLTKWKAERKDLRFGSVAMYYPLHEIYSGKECTPYFSVGPTFTHTKIRPTNFDSRQQEISRWSFGIITGMGMLLHINKRLDFGFVTQYIGQVGARFKYAKAVTNTRELNNFPVQLPDTRVDFEGQLLFCMSINYTLGDMW